MVRALTCAIVPSVVFNTDRSYPDSQVYEWMRQAALGLQHLHKSNIIHRDIKLQKWENFKPRYRLPFKHDSNDRRNFKNIRFWSLQGPWIYSYMFICYVSFPNLAQCLCLWHSKTFQVWQPWLYGPRNSSLRIFRQVRCLCLLNDCLADVSSRVSCEFLRTWFCLLDISRAIRTFGMA